MRAVTSPPPHFPEELVQARKRIAELEAEMAHLKADLERRDSPPGELALHALGITEPKRLAPALTENDQQLKFYADILAATNDAVIALDAGLCIRYCNAAAERIYGVRLAEVVGKPLPAVHGYAWLDKEDEQRSLEDLAQRGSWKGEYIHLLKDGSQIVVHSTVNVLPAEAGGGMVAVIRDITGRKQEEMRTKEQTQQLARANEDLLHFAYAVSHDLLAPLRTITSFSQLLGLKYKAKLGAEGGKFIQWIVDAGTRMDTMLRDLLRFATVAGGDAELDKNVSLNEVLSTALASLRTMVAETQAVITQQSLPAVAGNTGQLVQLFQNLIGNALKYHKPGTAPIVHVTAERSGQETIVNIRDNGLGFESKYAERIFGVFERLHGKEFSGTGIGLTICKRIVERRGGRIWAEGKPGEGATFSFSIPDATVAVQAAPAMDWGRVRAVLENHAALPVPAGHFDELFKLLDLAPAMVRKLDGTILIWTKGAERLFEWTEAEAVGKNLHELTKSEFSTPLTGIESDLLRNGEWSGEFKARKRDGTAIWLATHTILHRDGSGRPESVIEVHNNITPLKEAQAALARSSEMRDLALAAAHMGVWRWDTRTGVVEWSETLEALLGMPPGSFEGTFEAFKKRNHPDHWGETQAAIDKAFQSGTDYQVETRLLRNDGSYCWVRGQGNVIFGENNEPAGLIGVVFDISERKQRDADRQFLLDLSAKVAGVSTPEEVAGTTVREVAHYLGVARCVYSQSDTARKRMRKLANYQTEGPPPVDSLALEDYPHIAADLTRNQVVVVSDVESDPRTSDRSESRFLARGVRSFLLVPLHRDGIWLAHLGVSDTRVRVWKEREIALLHAVAQRLEAALDIARLLQESKVRQTNPDVSEAARRGGPS